MTAPDNLPISTHDDEIDLRDLALMLLEGWYWTRTLARAGRHGRGDAGVPGTLRQQPEGLPAKRGRGGEIGPGGLQRQGMSKTMPTEDYPRAGLRLYQDADRLLQAGRLGTASHLFGLAAECALKACMDQVPGDREIPRRHIPELLDDVKSLFKGRLRAHIRQVVDNPDFMHGWHIANRYWPDHCFDVETCRRLRQDARKALSAISGVV